MNFSQKLLYIIALLSSVIIICLFGFSERSHPEFYDIPFGDVLIQPDSITCGPTCATMLLHHYGNKVVTIKEVEIETKTVWFGINGKEIGMTSPDYLPLALRKFGLHSVMKYGSLDTLKHYVSNNQPCIVLVRSGERTWHYVIVCGFTRDSIKIINPASGGIYEIGKKMFIGSWSWRSDLDGNSCTNFYATVLKMLEIYPYTLIVPCSNK